MAARRGAQSLVEALQGLSLTRSSIRSPPKVPLRGCIASLQAMATKVPSPASPASSPRRAASLSTAAALASASTVVPAAERTVPVTVFAFPSLEPRALELWPAQHLHLPLRRDLLHLAVVYEGDNTRQGTASSKTRYDVHGSHRKMRPQKGTGRARAGSRQSPLYRGGGKVFGPHPRDFGTDLNRKVYDRAWRTALSYRYRRGELFVVQDGLDLPLPPAFLRLAQDGSLDRELEDGFVRRYVCSLLDGPASSDSSASSASSSPATTIGAIGLPWGAAAGRTTFITTDHRPNLFTSLDIAGEHARALAVADVDVKDLLETGRIVVERAALCHMIQHHQSDLSSRIFIDGVRQRGPPVGHAIVQ